MRSHTGGAERGSEVTLTDVQYGNGEPSEAEEKRCVFDSLRTLQLVLRARVWIEAAYPWSAFVCVSALTFMR